MASEVNGPLFTVPVIAGTIALYWFVATTYNFLKAPQPPYSLPWQGYGKGWIAGLRNFFALTESKQWILDGYEKYGKNSTAFVLPAVFSMPAEIVVPRSQISWLLDQPDSVLSTKEAHYDILNGEYAFVRPHILQDPYHEHVIHKNLARNINSVIPDLEEEVPSSVEAVYGMDTEHYQEVDVLESFMKMIPRLTNRLIVGPSLCREQKYLDAVFSFTTDVTRMMTVLHLIPKPFHPVVGNLLGLASKYHYWLASQFTLPLVKQRLDAMKKKDDGNAKYTDYKEPHDFITWSYRTAQAEGRPEEMDPHRIAVRIMPINFASIHTTSITAYGMMTSILHADPSVIESLREEASRVLQEEGGFTKQALSRMHRMDSAIRESQRIALTALTFTRKVVAKEGVILPEGVRADYGTLLSFPWTPVAQDEELYSNALEFDAFRYSRGREEYDTMTPEEKKNVDALKLKQTGLVTTSTKHLAFGHGRHACPGRFFVGHELKMIFAHLLLNYDFKPLKEKPKRLYLARIVVPLPATVEFKRRKSVWKKTL